MSELGRFLALTIGSGIICLVVASMPMYFYLGQGSLIPFSAGWSVGLLNILIAYVFNKKALRKDEGKVVIKNLLFGIFLRFLVVAVALILVGNYTNFNILIFASSLLGFYFLLQVFEVSFLQRSLSQYGK